MNLLTQEMRRTYAAQRGVSQGASITLAAVSGGFQARFECARRCAEVLGNRGWQDEGKTLFLIPLLDLHSAITKLAETFSVALVDTVTDEQGSRFVLVWKITPRGQIAVEEFVDALEEQPQTVPADELDEY
jgi:hypothetical protein